MSAKLTGAVWELDLPHKQQSVLLALADNAHDDGTNCYPGVDYLAWKTGYDRRSIQRILRQLEATEIVVSVVNAEGGRGRELEYRIDLSKGIRKRPWREVREEIRERKRVSNWRPLSDVKDAKTPLFSEETKGDNLTPFPLDKGRQDDSQRAASETLKGDKTDPKGRAIDRPNHIEPSGEPKNELTHTAARTPPNNNDRRKECVCATPHGSKLCDEERIRIAHNLPGVHFPERYAMTSEARRGTYDEAFLKRQKELRRLTASPGNATTERDTSACPDCRGTGFWYPAGDTPEGRAKGTAKCSHSRLPETHEEELQTK